MSIDVTGMIEAAYRLPEMGPEGSKISSLRVDPGKDGSLEMGITLHIPAEMIENFDHSPLPPGIYEARATGWTTTADGSLALIMETPFGPLMEQVLPPGALHANSNPQPAPQRYGMIPEGTYEARIFEVKPATVERGILVGFEIDRGIHAGQRIWRGFGHNPYSMAQLDRLGEQVGLGAAEACAGDLPGRRVGIVVMPRRGRRSEGGAVSVVVDFLRIPEQHPLPGIPMPPPAPDLSGWHAHAMQLLQNMREARESAISEPCLDGQDELAQDYADNDAELVALLGEVKRLLDSKA